MAKKSPTKKACKEYKAEKDPRKPNPLLKAGFKSYSLKKNILPSPEACRSNQGNCKKI
jgi:hypothetical protein